MRQPSIASTGSVAGLLVLGGAIQAGFLGMLAAAPRPGATAPFLVLFLFAFVCYALAVRYALRPSTAPAPAGRDRAVRIALALACLYRCTFLFSPPALSGDLHRYLWDGRVLLSGRNPYLEPPDSPALSAIRDEDYRLIEHKEVRTIYPPAAQILFAAGAAAAPGVFGIKALLVLADLLGIAALRRLLALRGLPPLRVIVYAWNPLAVSEVAWSGHIEPAGIACVVAAAVAIIQKRDLRSTLALTLAGLVKLLPFVLFVPLARSLRARAFLLPPILIAAAYWPFRAAGASLFSGFREYAAHWHGNDSIFSVARAVIAFVDPTPALKAAIAFVRARLAWSAPLDHLYPYVYPTPLAKAACALALVACAVAIARRTVDPLRGCFLMTGAALLLSPTLHPWYLVWILPWLCLFPSRPWILLSGLAALAYANLGAARGAEEPYPWVRLAEYGPFYALLLAEWLRARRRRPAGPAVTCQAI